MDYFLNLSIIHSLKLQKKEAPSDIKYLNGKIPNFTSQPDFYFSNALMSLLAYMTVYSSHTTILLFVIVHCFEHVCRFAIIPMIKREAKGETQP